MSICEATTLDRISRPSATTAAAVSSQDDSMPRMRTPLDSPPMNSLCVTKSTGCKSLESPRSLAQQVFSALRYSLHGISNPPWIDKSIATRLLCERNAANLLRFELALKTHDYKRLAVVRELPTRT